MKVSFIYLIKEMIRLEFLVHIKLDHPAITKVYDIKESKTSSYLIAEYCDFSL